MSARSPDRQQGITLIIALVLLAALSMLAAYAADGALLDERTAGNERSRIVALEAAEAALADAERSLPMLLGQAPDCDVLFTSSCTNGLCGGFEGAPAAPLWSTHAGKAIEYGAVTRRTAFSVGERTPARQPKWLIEFVDRNVDVRNVRVADGMTRRALYRIYAWGYGFDSKSQVLIESLVSPADNLCFAVHY